MPKLEDIELFAWVGEDEDGSGDLGLKQALTPCGLIPLVSVQKEKLDHEVLVAQLQNQANIFGTRPKLCRFKLVEVEAVIEPEAGKN